MERPQLLDQPVVEFPAPFALEKLDNRGATLKKFGAIAPTAVLSIGERDTSGIARVPRVLCAAHFLEGSFQGKRREWRTALGIHRRYHPTVENRQATWLRESGARWRGRA